MSESSNELCKSVWGIIGGDQFVDVLINLSLFTSIRVELNTKQPKYVFFDFSILISLKTI